MNCPPISPGASSAPIDFRVVHKRRNCITYIALLSNDTKFLEEKWKMIAAYTQKVDPHAPINREFKLLPALKTIPIKEQQAHPADPFEDLSDAEIPVPVQEYTHMVALHDVLPRTVRELYGDHSLHAGFGDQYAAAVMCAGVYPGMQPNLKFKNLMNAVPLSDLSSGDMVIVSQYNAFLYLDDDLCIEAPYRRGPLHIVKTSEALTRNHDAPPDALKKSYPNVSFWRKKKDWSFPEKIMPQVLEFYQLYPLHCIHSYDEKNFSKLIMEKLKQIRVFSDEYTNLPMTEENRACLILYTTLIGTVSIRMQKEMENK